LLKSGILLQVLVLDAFYGLVRKQGAHRKNSPGTDSGDVETLSQEASESGQIPHRELILAKA
jgi:hypothetical protein